MTTTTKTLPSGAGRIESHDAGRRHSRAVLIAGLVVAFVVLFVVALASVFLGTRDISAGQIVDTFFRYDDQNTDHLVVWTLRVPRTLAGILVGVSLGLAGAVMQGVARNPLADPGLLGVNAGAALAVVCAISILGVGTAMGYVWFAFVGAAIVSVLVYVIGSLGREGATPVKLALAGAAMTAALQSITTAILLTDVATFDKYRFWTVGALSGRKLELIAQVAPFVAVGVVLALSTGRLLNALSLGDDVARGLGQRVGLARALSAAAVVILCGSATAMAGPIGFLGLTIPHVARLITGPDYRWILPYSMVLAPILLLVSDIVGRLVAKPGELQVGIVMAVLGAPFFIALVRRRKLAEL